MLRLSRGNSTAYIVLALFITALIQSIPILYSKYPYGADGLYAAHVVYDILKNSHVTPEYYVPTYLNILVAVMQLVSGISALSLIRFVPLFLSILTILAFFLVVEKKFQKKNSRIAVLGVLILLVNEYYLIGSSMYRAQNLATVTALLFLYSMLMAKEQGNWKLLSFFMLFATAAAHHLLSSTLLLAALLASIFSKDRKHYLQMAAFISLSLLLFWGGVYKSGLKVFYVMDSFVKAWNPYYVLLGAGLLFTVLSLTSRVRKLDLPGRIKAGEVFFVALLLQLTGIAVLSWIGTSYRPPYILLLDGTVVTIALGVAGLVSSHKSKELRNPFISYWAIAIFLIAGALALGRYMPLQEKPEISLYIYPLRFLIFLLIPMSIFAARYVEKIIFIKSKRHHYPLYLFILFLVVTAPFSVMSGIVNKTTAERLKGTYQFVEPQEYMAALWIDENIPDEKVVAGDVRVGTLIMGVAHNVVTFVCADRIFEPESITPEVITLLMETRYAMPTGPYGDGVSYIYVSDLMRTVGTMWFPTPGNPHVKPFAQLSGDSLSKFNSPIFDQVYDNGLVRIYGLNNKPRHPPKNFIIQSYIMRDCKVEN